MVPTSGAEAVRPRQTAGWAGSCKPLGSHGKLRERETDAERAETADAGGGVLCEGDAVLLALMKDWILLLCELVQDLDVEIIPANLVLARPALRRSTTTCRHTIYHIANTSATAM